MKVATSATVFRDAVGYRLSITYSEVDENNGRILADNKRTTKVITDSKEREYAEAIMLAAQNYADTISD